MDPISQKLETLHGQICLLCIGNPDGGDDAVGVRIGEELICEGMKNVIIAGTEPERHFARGELDAFDHVIFIDAVDFRASPGSLVFLGAEDMTSRFAQVSTHRMSLGMLAKLVKSKGVDAWLLGIQPATLSPGWNLSESVQKAMTIAHEILIHRFHAGAAC